MVLGIIALSMPLARRSSTRLSPNVIGLVVGLGIFRISIFLVTDAVGCIGDGLEVVLSKTLQGNGVFSLPSSCTPAVRLHEHRSSLRGVVAAREM